LRFFATALALLLGTLAAAAMYRFKFFGKESITLLILLPIALPGIINRHEPARRLCLGDVSVQLLDHRSRVTPPSASWWSITM
jgi:hypothetical protein